MGTLVEKLSNCYNYILRLSGFIDLSGKEFLITLNSPNLIAQQCFARSMWIKPFVFLVSLEHRDIITVKSVTLCKKPYFSLKVFIKSKKKKADTNFVLLCQLRNIVESSKELICIDQSRFYIFSHLREIQNL